MATPVWPASLPQRPSADDWSWTPQDNRVTFKPDVGGTLSRRRASAFAKEYRATFPPVTDAQLATFETFYEDDLVDGSLHYLWTDPIDATSYKWKINSYSVKSLGAGWHEVSMEMSRLPGAAV